MSAHFRTHWLAMATLIAVVPFADAMAETRRARKVLSGHERPASCVTYSPDGRLLASASGDKTVKLWDTQKEELYLTLRGHEGGVNSVVFSPNGKLLASASDDKTVRLWDTASGKEIRILKGHSDRIPSVGFLRDGKTLASSSWDKTIRFWDIATGNEERSIVAPDRVLSLRVSPGGATVAAAVEALIVVWDVKSGKKIATLEPRDRTVPVEVEFSPDGKTLASGSNKIVTLWDLSVFKERLAFRQEQDVDSIVFSPNGAQVITSGGLAFPTVSVWDAVSGERKTTFKASSFFGVLSMVVSPDGSTLASTGSTVMSSDKVSGDVLLWTLRDIAP